MERNRLAALLVETGNANAKALLERLPALADVELAYLLKDICLDGWSSHPAQALGAARALKVLSELNPIPEIIALTAWAAGLESLVEGRMEEALSRLDDSQSRFLALQKPHVAAGTQVSKLVALAMLGRYEEAIECGLCVHELFLEYGDLPAVGKIEHNIGNIYFRRDLYKEAEKFQRSARARFVATGDQIQIMSIENSLALTLSQQHKIGAAEKLYQQALARAEQLGLLTTQAAIESSIGTLALYQGRYDRAFNFLERARRKYSQLKLSHLSAMTEQEIADAYLEINLAPEAAEIYGRVSQEFARLGMRAEEARALAYHGRAQVSLGQPAKAEELLSRARELYAAEGNEIGAATVQLIEAQISYARGDFNKALQKILEVEQAFTAAGDAQRLCFTRWLHGETARANGSVKAAEAILAETLSTAEADEQNEIAWRCLCSLGLLAGATGDQEPARDFFLRAVEVIEALRAPLPAEEFRTAFLSDKLQPYSELLRLSLNSERVTEALIMSERARSRALVETLTGTVPLELTARDAFEARILKQIDQLRNELNYFYNQIDQRAGNPDQIKSLHRAVRERERKTLELSRQFQHHGTGQTIRTQQLDTGLLQRTLGQTTALIEYGVIDKQLFAFVVTGDSIEVVRNLGDEDRVAAVVAQFRFQIDSLRSGSHEIRKHLSLLTERARRHLASLYDQLIRPLEALIGQRNLAIVPQRSLHYLPFHALHNGDGYLIETREVLYAPSALVLQQCLARPPQALDKALLVGVADEQIPLVDDEIRNVANLFKSPEVLLNQDATIKALRRKCKNCDILHLACHARFRPDNPFFSSLKLGDSWLTVRDTYNLKLNCGIVTLSACETGLSTVAPGEELIGLARGFLSAGSSSVVLSLWTVDDQATAALMTSFYRELLKPTSVATALRAAQLEMLRTNPHPFFWSPFIVIGKG